jgi:hypothetical protein
LDETARGEGGFGSTGVKKMRVDDASSSASSGKAVVTSTPAGEGEAKGT